MEHSNTTEDYITLREKLLKQARFAPRKSAFRTALRHAASEAKVEANKAIRETFQIIFG